MEEFEKMDGARLEQKDFEAKDPTAYKYRFMQTQEDYVMLKTHELQIEQSLSEYYQKLVEAADKEEQDNRQKSRLLGRFKDKKADAVHQQIRVDDLTVGDETVAKS